MRNFNRLLKSSIEKVSPRKETRADDEAESFDENLRQLLMASPLGKSDWLQWTPGTDGLQVVCLDEQGHF